MKYTTTANRPSWPRETGRAGLARGTAGHLQERALDACLARKNAEMMEYLARKTNGEQRGHAVQTSSFSTVLTISTNYELTFDKGGSVALTFG